MSDPVIISPITTTTVVTPIDVEQVVRPIFGEEGPQGPTGPQGPVGPSNIHVGPTPPADTNMLWVDTS